MDELSLGTDIINYFQRISEAESAFKKAKEQFILAFKEIKKFEKETGRKHYINENGALYKEAIKKIPEIKTMR